MSLVHVGPVATTALLMLLSVVGGGPGLCHAELHLCFSPIEQPLSVDITSEMPTVLRLGNLRSFQIDGTATVSAES